jgi:hypothetical protein
VDHIVVIGGDFLVQPVGRMGEKITVLMHVIGADADKCRPIGGEESDQLRHFLRLARPADGNASEHVHDPLASGLLADTIVLPPCGGSNPDSTS